jgi:predicted glycosyltransferase
MPSISDAELVSAIEGAEKIVARSGYSTIMDLEALGALQKAELHPTPGQSEQEYLAQLHRCNLQKNS